MANQILRDCKLWVAQYDLSGKMNALALEYGVETRDDTVFGDDTKSSAAGIKTVSFAHEGYFDTGTGGADEVLYGKVGVADVPMSISPQSGAEGELAYFFKSLQGKYATGAKVGDLLNFQVSGGANSDLVRGKVMLNGTKTATGTSTPIQLGAVSAAQRLFAALHLLVVSGTTPSLTVKVQSAPTEGFAAPTDRITFAAQNAAIGVWATPLAGPVTDTWWRISYTISGGTPSFQFIVPVGIL